MNYGQSSAVMVVVGERMGFSMANLDHAKQVLNGARIHPMHHAAIESEAVSLNNQLSDTPEMVDQANKVASAVIAEFRLA